MANKALIEGIVVIIIGLVGMGNGVFLALHKDPFTIEDKVGPGRYVFFISFFLMITGISYLISQSKKNLLNKEPIIKKGKSLKMVKIFLVLAIYVFFIDFLGYIVATIPFFLAIFKIMGFKSWLLNVILSITLSITLYIIFVHYLHMVFPR